MLITVTVVVSLFAAWLSFRFYYLAHLAPKRIVTLNLFAVIGALIAGGVYLYSESSVIRIFIGGIEQLMGSHDAIIILFLPIGAFGVAGLHGALLAALLTKGEQGSAHQSTTRFESKSE